MNSINLLDETKKWLLERCKADQKGNLKRTREATVYFVYEAFGIALLRKEFTTDTAFKDFIITYLPDCIGDWKTLLAIGKHFKYDDNYLSFLDENSYVTSSAQRSEITKIGAQLKELASQYGPLDTPKQLQSLFESGRLIGETTAAKEEGQRRPAPEPVIDEEPEPAEADAGPTPAEINFNKRLNSLIFKVQNFSSADTTFRDLLRLRPPSRWDTIRVEYLKEALLKTGRIVQSLVELLP